MITDEGSAQSFVRERCTDDNFNTLTQFVDRLVDEAAKQNLISRNTVPNIWQRHIADSAQLLDHVPRETRSLLDLGSGAGLPGIVIAIMRPEISVTLVESRRKRFEWLESVAVQLAAKNCWIMGSRLELIESFPVDVITARAFAPLPKLLILAERFSTKRTTWLLPKGESAAQEMLALPKKQRKMFHVEQSQTAPSAGILVAQGLRNGRAQ